MQDTSFVSEVPLQAGCMERVVTDGSDAVCGRGLFSVSSNFVEACRINKEDFADTDSDDAFAQGTRMCCGRRLLALSDGRVLCQSASIP